VAAGTVVATSTDAITWSVYPTNPPANLTRIVYANGLFEAAGYAGPSYSTDGKLLSSLNGVDWTVRYSTGGRATGVAYANGTFLAVSGLYGINPRLYKSLDGINWSLCQFSVPQVDGGAFGLYYYPYGYSPTVCAHGGSFLAAGLDGILLQSDDTSVPISPGSTRMTPLGFTFSFDPQIGEPYRILMSTDLQMWENLDAAVGNESPTSFFDFTATHSARRFFRVVSP